MVGTLGESRYFEELLEGFEKIVNNFEGSKNFLRGYIQYTSLKGVESFSFLKRDLFKREQVQLSRETVECMWTVMTQSSLPLSFHVVISRLVRYCVLYSKETSYVIRSS